MRFLLAAAAAATLTLLAAGPRAADATPSYRFVVPPSVTFADGTLRASLRIQDKGGDAFMSTIGRRSRHCFGEPVDPSFTDSAILEHPRAGRIVKVRLLIGVKVVATTRVALRHELIARGEDQDAPYVAALRC
jgi:hypothetical protein